MYGGTTVANLPQCIRRHHTWAGVFCVLGRERMPLEWCVRGKVRARARWIGKADQHFDQHGGGGRDG